MHTRRAYLFADSFWVHAILSYGCTIPLCLAQSQVKSSKESDSSHSLKVRALLFAGTELPQAAFMLCLGSAMSRRLVATIAFVVGFLILPMSLLLYLRYGAVPVAVTDPALPDEKQIVHIPLHARIAREMPHEVPLPASEENLLAGAAIYQQQCAFCHGLPGYPAAIAKHMYPAAPGLWVSHRAGVVGVSDDPAGETYWKVKNGIRLAGMPAYADLLSEKEMWQVTLLVKAADQPLSSALTAALAPVSR